MKHHIRRAMAFEGVAASYSARPYLSRIMGIEIPLFAFGIVWAQTLPLRLSNPNAGTFQAIP